MSIVLGLTGPTGAGKSIASAVAKGMGVKVIDCDKTAREVTAKGSDALKSLAAVFGKEILNGDGTLNRKALAAVAFKTSENTELLNKTVLPFIAERIKAFMGNGDVLLDAPTLFESGIDEICTDTVAILADGKHRLKRIIERDNITEEEARLRMSAGKDDEYYLNRAGHIIYNNGKPEDMLSEIKKLFIEIYGGK